MACFPAVQQFRIGSRLEVLLQPGSPPIMVARRESAHGPSYVMTRSVRYRQFWATTTNSTSTAIPPLNVPPQHSSTRHNGYHTPEFHHTEGARNTPGSSSVVLGALETRDATLSRH